ncbi:MAG: tetraacyldisaccharide 4'-kinase [Maritimibacter sp.]|nr:tetraacyldisaccharide 4'-kinase [Maritimibacter sp.]
MPASYTPAFWYRPPGPLLRLVGPLAPGRRKARTRNDAALMQGIPSVAVTSLTLGGTGKTPAVIALAQRLASRGTGVHVVSRGSSGPVRIDARGDDPAEVGDEPLLIAAFAPTWIAADPREGIAAAAEAGAEAVVLDVGPGLPPHPARITIAVEDAARGFGNGFAWPLGPLGEKLEKGLNRVDLLLIAGPKVAQESFARAWRDRIPCATVPAELAPLPTGMEWEGLDVIAFAGIGAPERFFATLRGLGANLIRAQALSDHQEMTPTLLARLDAEARRTGAQLVTTEKDAVRLPRDFRQNVVSLPVRLEPADWSAIDALLP